MAQVTLPTADPGTRPLAGILWMMAFGLGTVAMNGLIHVIGPSVPAAQGAFLRFAFGVVILLPVLLRTPRVGLPAGSMPLFLLRGLFHSLAVICWFYALARLTPSESTAIGYLHPVAMLAGGVIILGERLTGVRIGAVAVALVGTLVILRPGLREVGLPQLAMLGAAVLYAASFLTAKILARQSSPATITAVLSLTVTVGLAGPALAVWQPITMAQVGLLALAAGIATLGQVMLVRALSLAPVSVLQPVTFLQLIWATLLTTLVFGEPVDGLVLLGGALIIGAVCWAALVEARGAPGAERSSVGAI